MKIISVKTLRDFWAENPDAEQPLKAWVDEATKADWKTPAEIKDQYRSASILKNKRVVFNIKGNDYRLIVTVAYLRGWVFVKFIGSHKEYDEINAETIERK
ncbi:type II toxin-antitoxin system HigB family toxin [Klebsiella pneumoniae]|uniref:type II toxin-antitoxin system HigB family toxin n=1 Tax=Klebsiella pneumoniae TaxID=573 RepID=UPI0029653424|nr:type II toxin-antitoxin system HigB family toxin [Klebsiella pneumoniae]EIV5257593.1 type II toxin-antitoxin system HigB family toxin [Klebsiella pneumoniae]MDW1409272.1 type II toxin-antitoxin system HigB family toxin [Klebsiella pneumoniae]